MAEVVEVVYALPEVQRVIEVPYVAGMTLGQAISASGLTREYPNLDLTKVGVFGHLSSLDRELKAGDRVEIYRPLAINPIEARRRRLRKC